MLTQQQLLAAQNWPNMGYQIPGLMMPVARQGDLQKLMQNGNIGMTHLGGSVVQYPASSVYDMGQVTPAIGIKNFGAIVIVVKPEMKPSTSMAAICSIKEPLP